MSSSATHGNVDDPDPQQTDGPVVLRKGPFQREVELARVFLTPPFQATVEMLRAVFTRDDIVKRPNQPDSMGR